MTARNKFIQQLQIVKHALTNNSILLGDFNLDYNIKYDHNYENRPLFEDFEEHLSGKDLVQLANFDTWSRIVNLTLRTSIIDHVYVKDPTNLSELEGKKLCFSDHDLIMLKLETKCLKKIDELKRDWRFYSKLLLCNKLSEVRFDLSCDTVQDCWNDFENKLIVIVDELLPMRMHCNNLIAAPHCPFIKQKLNLRRRLLNFLDKCEID